METNNCQQIKHKRAKGDDGGFKEIQWKNQATDRIYKVTFAMRPDEALRACKGKSLDNLEIFKKKLT